MKKFFYGMMAATMMFASSCQNELEVGAVGEESVVSFTISTPDMGSRAYSDGSTATVLQYAVYEGETELKDLTVMDATINGSTTVELKLATGKTYNVIFWAAAPNAPYTFTPADGKVSVDYDGAISNNENLDAFYAVKEITVKGAQTETIELRRPFAQLNIGTSDYDEAKSAGYEPTVSKVVVSNVYNSINLWDGEVSGNAEVTFDYNDIDKEETFPVSGYKYLAMNYLLVKNIKELVEVTFSYKEESGEEQTRKVGSVPVQRNYRTNIYGQLLTSDVAVNVEIVPEYDGTHEADEFMLALAVGGNVDVTEDIDLGENFMNINKGVIINANGNTLNVAENQASGYGALVSGGATAVFNDANIVSGGAGINVQSGSKVEFNDGSIVVNSDTNSGQRYIFYAAQEGTTVTINGGTFSFTNAYRKIAYICADYNAKVYVTGGEFGAPCQHPSWKLPIVTANGGEVIITGGTFGFDPTEWVAKGYRAAKVGNKWTVVAEDSYAVGEVVDVEGVKSIVFSTETGSRAAAGAKAVSVAELNMAGKNWQNAMDWAASLGEGWELASIYDLDAIHAARFALNDALEADSKDNALFEEDEYFDASKNYYALYVSSTEAVGNDPQGEAYFANRVHVKYFNTNGYWDYPYSTFATVNKNMPFKNNYFARAVYTVK